MPDLRRHARLMLLAAVEKYGPCDYAVLFADLCHENGWPAEHWVEQQLWTTLVELSTAGLVTGFPSVEITEPGRDVLAAAAVPPGRAAAP